MNRIDRLFSEKKGDILSLFFTAGFPGLEDMPEILAALDGAECDLVEIGMPYSDPLADGPTIQQSSQRAIRNGMTLERLFAQLTGIRDNTDLPLILMGYLNPVMQYGMERFCQSCAACGIDGLILPDLPLYEYEAEYRPLFEKHGLHNVFLVTPSTPEERIRQIDRLSKGFIYLVSSAAVTGAKQDLETAQEAYFSRIKAMNLSNPYLIGFGIGSHAAFGKACQHAAGAIVGSAFIKALENSENVGATAQQFVRQIRGAKTPASA